MHLRRLQNVALARRIDPESGKLSIATVVHDDKDGVTGLYSAFGVTVSGDGNFVYAVSGQHGGGKDNCVGTYEFDNEKGALSRLQEIYPAETEVDDNERLGWISGLAVPPTTVSSTQPRNAWIRSWSFVLRVFP